MEVKTPNASPEAPELDPSSENEKGGVGVEALQRGDSNDGDEALKAFIGHEGEVIVMTAEMEKKLLWKIDRNIMPVGLHVFFSVLQSG